MRSATRGGARVLRRLRRAPRPRGTRPGARAPCARCGARARATGPSRRPASRSGVGSSPPRPKRSSITSRSCSGSWSSAARTVSSRRPISTSSWGSISSLASRSPSSVSPSCPTGPLEARDRCASPRASRCSSSSVISAAAATSSSVGGRPSWARQLALDARDLALALADVHRDADRAALVGEPALDRLPDPERRVGRELVALAASRTSRRRGSGPRMPSWIRSSSASSCP